eukprot:snap_masked-scaffold_14-processed-gene-6.20-mRNA-1 protein AED:0.05 eAED:0.05 QI:0/-1/0/1/-1/1/1/0/415
MYTMLTRQRALRKLRFFSTLSLSPEIQALKDTISSFAKTHVEPQAAEFNRKEHLNLPLLKSLGELGLLGLTVPEQFGGSEAGALASCIVHEELSKHDPAFCLSYLAHSLLFVNNLNQNGSQDQKEKFLPGASSGEIIGGMGMSEPNAGTDVLGLTSRAKKIGSDYVLSGRKMWITNGCVTNEHGESELGDVFQVYAKTGEKRTDLSLFLVEKGMEGFYLGQQIKDKLGMRASTTAELVFDDVHIPAENLVGKENGAVECMMRNLEIERLCLGAMSIGIAGRCLEAMTNYAKGRQAFGKSISNFGQIQQKIAQSYTKYKVGKTFLYDVAKNLDEAGLDSVGNRLDTDAVKLFCAKIGKELADDAIQVLGGNGYVGEYVVERLWRDAKLIEIGGGTLESHEKNIMKELEHLDIQQIV